ncbi:GTP 3',8-cyclase [Xanthomonas sacchari]|nr:GTP 3',8-cyclase [Xanthomonas sacchari]
MSADGHLYTCLFAGEGTDLRPALAGGEEAMVERVRALWERRDDRYSELRGAATATRGKHVEMFLIGG